MAESLEKPDDVSIPMEESADKGNNTIESKVSLCLCICLRLRVRLRKS